MFRTSTWVGCLLGVCILMTSAAPSYAGGRGGFRQAKVEADIESLEARIRHEAGNWRMDVRYEVEIEDAAPGERFNLALSLVDGNCPVRDASGRPLAIVIPLARPACIRGDEWRFRDGTSTCLPNGTITDPRRLRIRAELVSACGSCTFDRDETCVRFDACGRGCTVCDRLCGRVVEACGPTPRAVGPAPRVRGFVRRERVEHWEYRPR